MEDRRQNRSPAARSVALFLSLQLYMLVTHEFIFHIFKFSTFYICYKGKLVVLTRARVCFVFLPKRHATTNHGWPLPAACLHDHIIYIIYIYHISYALAGQQAEASRARVGCVAPAQIHIVSMSLLHHMQRLRPIQTLLVEPKGIERLTAGCLVPAEPLSDAAHHARQVRLYVCHVVQERGQGVVGSYSQHLRIKV